MFQNKKNEVNGENIEFNLYRNTLDDSGKYSFKFLTPSIIKGKIAFKLLDSLSSAEFNYTNMINNLIFSVDIIIIFSKVDDYYINKIKSRFVITQKLNDKLEEYKQDMIKTLEDMKGVTINESYILVDKRFKEKVAPFFNKHGFSVEYTGESETILEKNTFTEEEYKHQLELYSLVNDLVEED